MRFLILTALLAVSACTSEEMRLDDAKSAGMAQRIWTDPQVARAINVRATTVADYRPGADILVAMLPVSLSIAKYGEFDSFIEVFFDRDLATDAQVFYGMERYCAVLGRRLIDRSSGTMKVPPGQKGLKAWGFVSGLCR